MATTSINRAGYDMYILQAWTYIKIRTSMIRAMRQTYSFLAFTISAIILPLFFFLSLLRVCKHPSVTCVKRWLLYPRQLVRLLWEMSSYDNGSQSTYVVYTVMTSLWRQRILRRTKSNTAARSMILDTYEFWKRRVWMEGFPNSVWVFMTIETPRIQEWITTYIGVVTSPFLVIVIDHETATPVRHKAKL